jgi:hypothetical protein
MPTQLMEYYQFRLKFWIKFSFFSIWEI